MHAFAGGLALD